MISSPSRGKVSADRVRLWASYASYAIRRMWWLVLVCSAAAVCIGFFLTRRISNSYEARAAFTVQEEDMNREFERLNSRVMLLATIERQPSLRQSLRILHPRNGKLEMYDESPFAVETQGLATRYLDQEHRIKFVSDSEYVLVLKDSESEEKGTMGNWLLLPGFNIRVHKTQFWQERSKEFDYFLQIYSNQQLLGKIKRRLSIFQGALRPTRLELTFVDQHPGRALDFLETLCETYLTGYAANIREQVAGQRLQLVAQVQVLERQFLQGKDVQNDPWRTMISQQGYFRDASPVQELMRLDSVRQHVGERLSLWKKARLVSRLEILNGLLALGQEPQDCMVVAALSDPTVGSQTEDLALMAIRNAEQNDLRRQQVTDSLYLNASAQYLAAMSVLAQSLPANDSSAKGSTLLLTRYLATLRDLFDLDFQRMTETRLPELSDPPYVVSDYRDQLKLRNFVLISASGLFLGLFIALTLPLLSRRVLSFPQLLLRTDRDHLPSWRLETEPLLQRKQAASLALSLESTDKCLALIGDDATTHELARKIASQWLQYGTKCLVLCADPQPNQPWIESDNKVQDQPGWWMGSNATKEMSQRATEYDRILLCLPRLADCPEMLGALRHCQFGFLLMRKGQGKFSDWHLLERHTSGLEAVVAPIYVD